MLKPERTHPPESGVVFFAMPFGTQSINGAESCDFDTIYASAFAPTVEACGMKPERLDNLYGTQGVLEGIWRAIQRAEIVVIDFSLRNANVTFEYGLAWTLGKRVIALTQDPEDIPSDVRGLNRFIRYSQHFADIEEMKRELTLQLQALREEPAEERAPVIYNYPSGGMMTITASATITNVHQDKVFVETDDGRFGVMRNSDVDYCRLITDMATRFPVGKRVDGALLIDPQRGEARYTLLAGQTNPWPVLALRFPVGTVFTGVVRRSINAGVFVGLDATVNGLVPASKILGPPPQVGDPVEVVVTRMDPDTRRVTLELRSKRQNSEPVDPPQLLPPVGYRGYGTVVHRVPERDGRGGYILLELPDYPRAAMLLAQHMSDDLRADLNDEQVDLDEEIYVEVESVEVFKNRVLLRELPEPVAAAA